ncbi:MAG TPA: PilZ domain-containing protein [Gammaproteobacteria bacterium]|nr:PilZ domain-containing protein [Gammaproteobacteria bacterium]
MTTERRLYERIDRIKPVTFLMPNGESLEATGENLSLGGMQVRCPRWLIAELTPSPDRIARGQPVDLRVRFELPVEKNKPPVTIEARCNAVALRRLSEDEYHISLTFSFFEGNGYNDLEAFIDKNA